MKRDPSKLAGGEFDLLVIGGGISGACVARDGAMRGLRVALVDRGDFGGEASANSLRIVHGGLRYLQQLNLPRMRQSIGERSMWLRCAPHLVRPLGFMVTTHGWRARSRSAMRTALAINDMVGFDRNRALANARAIPSGYVVGADEARRLYPGADADRATGGATWHDAQMFHSERLVLAVVLDACAEGATAVNHVEIAKLVVADGRVTGARARDVLTGEAFEIRARLVVNAGGPSSARLVPRVPGRDTFRRGWQPVKGINVLVRRLAGDLAVGLSVPPDAGAAGADGGSRMIFVTPWRGLSLVGTDYYPCSDVSEACHATDEEVSRFIGRINAACPSASLTMADVLGVQAGVMPVGLARSGDRDVRFLEHHRVVDHERADRLAGLIGLVAIKYTTARLAARDVVDLAFRKLGRRSPGCGTGSSPVSGGDISDFACFESDQVARWSDRVEASVVARLAGLYGTNVSEVLELCAGRGEGPVGESDIRAAEVIYAVREEMAAKLGDLVFRRTDLVSCGHPGVGPISAAADVMADELAWDAARTRGEEREVLDELDRRRMAFDVTRSVGSSNSGDGAGVATTVGICDGGSGGSGSGD